MIASLSLAEMLCRMFVSFLARRSDDCAQFLEVALFHAQNFFACTSVLQKFLQQRLVGTEQSAPKVGRSESARIAAATCPVKMA